MDLGNAGIGLTPTTGLVVLIGVCLLAVSVWGWAGRSRMARWWVGRPFGPQLVLGLLPGLGLLVLGGGLLALAGTAVALAVALPMLLGAVLELAGMSSLLPGWWGPKWYRQLPRDRREFDPERSAAAAAIVGFLGRPGVTSSAEASARFGRAKPVASWRAGWVYDADTDQRIHGMSHKGTIDGRLTLYPSGVVFAASRAEDTLRGKSTVVAVRGDDITEVRVVPPRAGADGRPRAGRLYRSWFPRLVVRTTAETYLFDVAWGQAGKVAERLYTLIP
jgi:hypothetical protein